MNWFNIESHRYLITAWCLFDCHCKQMISRRANEVCLFTQQTWPVVLLMLSVSRLPDTSSHRAQFSAEWPQAVVCVCTAGHCYRVAESCMKRCCTALFTKPTNCRFISAVSPRIRVLLMFCSTVLIGFEWFDTAFSWIKAEPSLALTCSPALMFLRDESLKSFSALHACAWILPILLGSNTVRLHSARLIVPAEVLRCSSVGSMLSLWQCNLCIPM